MKKIIFILSSIIFSTFSESHAQGLQRGECGIRFTYDAAGNLTQREFICNNTGVVMYKAVQGEGTVDKKASTQTNKSDNNGKTEEIIKVNAIMPNPTTGKFTISLALPLNNGNVTLLDANGRVLERRHQSGNALTFDIGNQPSGMYLVRIESDGNVSAFKVIKQ